MKRIIVFCLSLLILISSMTGMLLTSVAAMTPYQIETYFENPDNWRFDGKNATTIGSDPYTVNLGNRTLTVGEETVSTLMIESENGFSSIAFPNIQKNTTYTFSFRYYSNSMNTANNSVSYIFKNYGIYAPDQENASFAWNTSATAGFIERVSYNASYSYVNGPTLVWNTYPWTNTSVANQWNEVTLTFHSNEHTNLAFVFVANAKTIYFDDFSLETNYFENAGGTVAGNSNWKVIPWASNLSNVTTNTQSFSTWATVNIQTNSTYTNNSKSSMIVKAKSQYPIIPLPEYRANTDYVLSFDYLVNSIGDAEYLFDHIGIYTQVDGANFAWPSSGPGKGFISRLSTKASYTYTNNFTKLTYLSNDYFTNNCKLGEWNTIQIPFNTENYEDLTLVMINKGAETYYVDNFQLTAYNAVSVENGSADAVTAAAGTTVTLTPAAAEIGKQFSHWEVASGTVTLSSTTTENATFVMPDEPVSVKAVYDYTLNDPDAGADRVIDIKGNSIRKQSGDLPQGLRYKFYMDNGFETLYEGYTVAKVGLLTLPSDYLQGQALTHQTYAYGGKNYAPIDKEVLAENYQYESGDTTNTYFTAALTNIAKEDYDLNYSVRPYTVYKHTDGTEITVYGTAVSANVFAVVYEILSTSEDDSDVVAAEAAIADCETEYNAWVAANRSANPVD